MANGTLVQTTGTSGRGALSYFTPKTLGEGESLTASFGFKLHGTPGSLFSTSAQWRFGLFNSNGAGKVDADNFGSASYHTGSAYDFDTQPGYAGFLGQTTSWSINNRNIANVQILSVTAAYTPVGDPETPAFTFDLETNYVVTLRVQRTAAGADITLTVAGGAFGAGTSFTRSDTGADAVSTFDTFAIHCLSNFSDSFSIDDVHLVYAAVTAPSITTQPASASVLVGATVTFDVAATGNAPLTYQWKKDAVDLPGETAATLVLSNVQPADSGDYTVAVTNLGGTVTSDAATLLVSTTAVAPTVATPPASQTLNLGAQFQLTVTPGGTAPFTYQWFKNGTTIDGATNASYKIASTTAADAGSYTVEITNAGGTVTSDAAVLTINSSYLANLSVRASMDAQQTLILGFVVTGGSKPVLIRAAGPALDASFHLTGYLADPRLTLYNAGATVLGSNDNWDNALADTFARLGAFPFVAGSKDAALLETITSANTTHAPAGTTGGIQLVELYDAGENNGVKLVNVSARNHVGTGDNILIAGFVISGEGKKHVLIRGIGPGLASTFGVSGVLADPKLTLFTSEGHAIESNDNWTSSLASTFSTLGAFALEANSKDAALLVELDPGVYTAQVAGADGGTGEALVEIYDAAP